MIKIKKYIKMLRPYDLIIVVTLVISSFLPAFVFAMTTNHQEGNDLYAVISVDGEEIDRFLLTGNEEQQLITYHPAPGQYNIIEIDKERIRNKEDNSREQIAVKMEWIQEPGQTIINVPHKLLIEIISENPTVSDIDVMAQ